MTMNYTPLGNVNGDSTATNAAQWALFEKIFSGEVMTSFEQKTIMLDKHMVRTISHGKSASFAVIGRTTATKHTPGTQVTGKKIVQNEKVITIDGLLLSDVFIANIEEAMNHYDVRGPYSTEMGRALASQYDKNVLQVGVLGSSATSLLTPQNPAGGAITDGDLDSATLATRVGAVVKACFTAAVKFDNNNVPDDARYLVCAPGTYMDIVQNTVAINKDWGGAGAFSTGTVTQVAGINIIKSPNVGFAQYAGGVVAGDNVSGGDHDVDMSYVYGLFFTPSAIGTVKLLDLSFEAAYLIDYQGTLMVAKYAMGHDWLRPECLIRLIHQ